MKFHVIHLADSQPRTKSRSCGRADSGPGGRLGQSLSSTASMSAAWRTRACAPTLTTCCTLFAGGRVFIIPATCSEGDLTESTLLDYVKFQSSHQPRPSSSTINDRVAVADRAIRNEFPDAPCQIARGFHQAYLRRRPLGLGRPRVAHEPVASEGAQTQHRPALGG